MGIKLKNKIIKYFTNVWLIEIVAILIFSIYVGINLYDSKTDKSKSKVLSDIQMTFTPQKYYEDKLKNSVKALNKKIYSDYTFLFYLEEPESDSEDYRVLSEYINNDIKFIFINKKTGSIITNDVDPNLEDKYYSEVINVNRGNIDKNNNTIIYSLESEIPEDLPDNYIYYNINSVEEYISEKYGEKSVSVKYDNGKNINPFLESKPQFVSNALLRTTLNDYEEIYYTSSATYYNKFESRMAYLVTFILIISAFILLKIILALLIRKGKIKIRGNFVASFFYVCRYGFRFKQTRKALLVTIIGLSIFFMGYLYLLAVGGYENNVVASFFSRYPFKGSFLLMVLPMIGIIYSIKKSIDIYLVNERLKEINKGNLDYEIVERGSNEIVELIQNIIEIKNGYKIAVDETLKNEKMKTELISNVSHDLRTPLTSIINYVNILGESNLTEEERTDYLKILEQKSKKLKVLIDDLFEMSKINSGKMELKKEKIEIMSLIHQAIGEYSYLYQDKNVDFVVECLNEEIYMNLDGKMMSRVFENVVINALKYSLENTRIYVEIKENKENIQVSVKNIANYKMEFNSNEVLERFVRGDKSRNSKVDGSGLGLAITKSIIELHGGYVRIIREGDMFKIYMYIPKG